MKIAVAGTGYVGLSLAVLLSQNHDVKAVDIVPEKVEKINKRLSPIQDKELEEYLAIKNSTWRQRLMGLPPTVMPNISSSPYLPIMTASGISSIHRRWKPLSSWYSS